MLKDRDKVTELVELDSYYYASRSGNNLHCDKGYKVLRLGGG